VGDATIAALDAAKVVKAAAAPLVPSPGPLVMAKAPPAPYTPPAVPGPHLVPAVTRPGFWARFKAALQGKAS